MKLKMFTYRVYGRFKIKVRRNRFHMRRKFDALAADAIDLAEKIHQSKGQIINITDKTSNEFHEHFYDEYRYSLIIRWTL